MSISDIYQFGRTLLDQHVLLIILALLVMAGVIYLSRFNIRSTWLNLRMWYRLKRLGIKGISNFEFPDGLGNHFTIDRLVMRHDGISLLMLMQYPGSIFCADDIDEWTQLLAGKSYRFKNPLIELEYQVKAVSARVPDVNVNGFLLFDHQARFPKGRPDRVIGLDSLPASLKRDGKKQVHASVESAWEELCASA